MINKLLKIFIYGFIFSILLNLVMFIYYWINQESIKYAFQKITIEKLFIGLIGGIIYLLFSQLVLGKDSPDGKIL